jgi:hypothetical protein
MWSWVPTGPEIKNDCAGEDQQQFTGLDWAGQNIFSQLLSESEGSQSRQTVEYRHESRGTRNQKSQCWRGPTAL